MIGNDPRVFFAAERTLLAWNRTSLALIAFGFVVERVGMLVNVFLQWEEELIQRDFSFWIGLGFILLGSIVAANASLQYRRVVATLRPPEIPDNYQVNSGVVVNLMVMVLGIALALYLMYF